MNKCSEKIKEFYNLNKDEGLYIISVDTLSKISNKVINDFVFEIYLKNGTYLDHSSISNNDTIFISTPIIKLDLANLNEIIIFNSQRYDIYNLSS